MNKQETLFTYSSSICKGFDAVSFVIAKSNMLNYGWLVVFCCFWLNVFQAGIAFCGGIMLNTLADEFGESRARVSMIWSVFCGIYLCTSPISDGLVKRFGLRVVCVGGCIIATVGFAASIFSTNLTSMIITQSVIGGIGIGLTYLPSIVAPNFYFKDQKAVAYGIGICGQGNKHKYPLPVLVLIK